MFHVMPRESFGFLKLRVSSEDNQGSLLWKHLAHIKGIPWACNMVVTEPTEAVRLPLWRPPCHGGSDLLCSLILLLYLSPLRHTSCPSQHQKCKGGWGLLFPAQRKASAHLYPPHGQIPGVLLDCVEPCGSQHCLCGHRPSQPAPVAHPSPL